ncbi:MAG: hypothetical protein ACI4WG_05320 [Erysipelotrichaceae bacterium]
MNNEKFNKVVAHQLSYCKQLLLSKGKEYSPEDMTQDRLHQFKVAAAIQGCNPKQALAGMMIKHTISIFDMCHDENVDYEKWEEKITDHINYLLLLKAIIEEETDERYSSESA